MKPFLFAFAVAGLISLASPADAAVGTFNVSGQLMGQTYTSVTVNTDSSWVRYNFSDGGQYTAPVPSNQAWAYFWYYAGQDRDAMSSD